MFKYISYGSYIKVNSARVLALCIGALLLTPQANAEVIRIDVKGTVTQVDPIFGGLVAYGDEMTASFAYDPSDISRTVYFDTDRAFHYTDSLHYEVKMGSVIVTGSGGRVESTNDYTDSLDRFWDRYIVQRGGVGIISSDLLNVFDIANLTAGITFYDYVEASALYAASQVYPENFNAFDHATVTIQMNLDNEVFDWLPMFARVTEIRVNSVNEPNAFALLGLGFAAIGFASRRRKIQASVAPKAVLRL